MNGSDVHYTFSFQRQSSVETGFSFDKNGVINKNQFFQDYNFI